MQNLAIQAADKKMLENCVKLGVIKALFERRIITRDQFELLMKQNTAEAIAV